MPKHRPGTSALAAAPGRTEGGAGVFRIIVVVALKFLLPVFYLKFPFAAGWGNFVLDAADGDILIPAGLPDATYQLIDKAADWVAYLFMFIWGWKREIRREIAATFALRTVGQALFFATRNELALFFFPNLLEPLFLIYVTMARLRGWDRVQGLYTAHIRPIWVGILLYKFQDEWITHVVNVDRSELIRRLLGM
jgi:hypothetical protein